MEGLLDEDLTLVKTVTAGGKMIKIPAIQNHAKQLLDEELTLAKTTQVLDELYEYNISDRMVMDADGQLCCICSSLCHVKCLTETEDGYICIACSASQEYIHHLESDDWETKPKQSSSQNAGMREEQINTDQQKAKPIPKPRKNKPKNSSIMEKDESAKIKQGELRQKELKLRKQEEQLKMIEKSLSEMKNERVVLESRCQQLEARNFELEQTVKILKRRIDSNELLTEQKETNHGHKNEPSNISDAYSTVKSRIDNRIAQMHLKISNIVLDEMDRQLDKLKLYEHSLSEDNNNTKDLIQILKTNQQLNGKL